jgi:rSAM/selenodomain-associated transferase 2
VTKLSIVIPTLNAADTLGAAIAALGDAVGVGSEAEIIVVDGGSVDGTPALAASCGAQVIATPPGRGGQLAVGAQAARREWLLFLHADTILEPGWPRAIEHFISKHENETRAATFRFALDDDSAAARRLEKLVAWRCRRLGLPYGDQGLVIARAFYDRLGGFRPLPLMEDVDFVRRIGRRRLDMLDARAVTSAARYRRNGWLLRSARNLCCLTLYFLGLPPRLIQRLYA